MPGPRPPRDRRHDYRRRQDQPWTWGDHDRYADGVQGDLERLESKVDRLTWLVAVGAGIISTAAFAMGLLVAFAPGA